MLKLLDTLFSRLVLTLFIGLLTTQIISAFFQFKLREQQLNQLKYGQLIQRLISAQQLLPVNDKAQQEKILNILSTPHLQVQIQADYQMPKDAPALPEQLRQLRQTLGTEADTFSFVANEGYFRIFVPLKDGSWVRFQRQAHEGQRLQWTGEIWWLLALLIASVLLLSIYPVMRMIRPLHQLAEAAVALGNDLSHPPLLVTGTQEVRRAAQAFNMMQAALQQYLDERTRLLAAISHDLKTPITRLRLRTELIDDPDLQAGFNRDLEEMQQMTVATLDFIRGMDAHEAKQRIDIYTLLRQIQQAFAETGQNFQLQGTSLNCLVHPLSLKRCLNNLIGNAFKYAEQVEVSLIIKDDSWEICVRDHGKGIPEKDLNKVFEPYVRLERSRNRQTGGTGLGLSIAQNIARLHGGEIQLNNHPEGGLCACVMLPLLKIYTR